MADKKHDKEAAKDPKAAEGAAPEGAEDTGPKRPSAIFALVKAIAFVGVIVIVEVVAASMFIPSAQDTERLAKQYVAASEGNTAVGGEESAGHGDGEAAEEDVDEVELGTFNVTHFNPNTNTTLSIDFELYGSVLAEHQAEFHELFEKNKIRTREQVILTLHDAESKDLSDAGLGLLKRQILEKTNRALGQPLLREVLFSKFNFIERSRFAAWWPRSFCGRLQGGTPRVSEESNPLRQDEVEKLLSEARQASAGATATAAAGASTQRMEGLLNEAEKALASVETPAAASTPLPAGVRPFEFRDLFGKPASSDAATLDLLRDVQLDLKIELGRTRMQLDEVLQLKRGAVVTLDKLAGDPVDIFVNGRLIARGEVLVLNDSFCVRVAELVAGETALD